MVITYEALSPRGTLLGITCVVHHTATSLLHMTEDHLRRREKEANTILPHAIKQRRIEERSFFGSAPSTFDNVSFWESRWAEQFSEDSPVCASHDSPSTPTGSGIWISVWSLHSPSAPTSPTLDLVLSCTASEIANLPLFIWANDIPLRDSFLTSRIAPLVTELSNVVRVSRVFSVFAPSSVAEAFAEAWSAKAGAVVEAEPFYEASFTYVTAETWTPSRSPVHPTMRHPYHLRAATIADLEAVAPLCKAFADTSIVYPLTLDAAFEEARMYITSRQLFVCEIEIAAMGTRTIASIIVVTRTTRGNATITKIYTDVPYRRLGYAEALVRETCTRLLFGEQAETGHHLAASCRGGCLADTVSLYVAHNNLAAVMLYHRIGFMGLVGDGRPGGIGSWTELGFVGTDRGFW